MEKLKTKEKPLPQNNHQEEVLDDLSILDIETENADTDDYCNKTAPVKISGSSSCPPGDGNNNDPQHIQFCQKSYGNLATLRFQKFNPTIQTKLSIGKPGDIYEQEADEIADQILKITDPEILKHPD